MLPVIWISVFISVSCLAWSWMRRVFAQQIAIRNRLDDFDFYRAPSPQAAVQLELSAGFGERVWNPIATKITALTQKYTPVRKKDFIEKKLDYAGRPHDWDASQFLSVQYAFALGAGVAFTAFAVISGIGLSKSLLFGIGGIVSGYLLLDFYLNNATAKQQNGIDKELPDALDLLTISIEAGLGFDAAMQRVVQKATGPLAKEFNQAIQEMRIGKTRREALRDMSVRNGVRDLDKFVDAILQADQLGVSLGNVLRTQSDQIRVLRRQKVEEKAMKAPVKMLLPMVLFIFPVIFIVILGPAAIQLMETINL